MSRPTFTPRDVLAALCAGKATNFDRLDYETFGDAPAGSVKIDDVWAGWLVVVGASFQIEAFNNDGDGFQLIDGAWVVI